MESERKRWNERYQVDGFLMGETPSRILVEQFPLLLTLCPGRRALDLACGEGRNGIFLAKNGFSVTAIDISEVALAKGIQRAVAEGVTLEWLHADLESFQINGQFDLILNINFLLRELFGKCVAALAPGGVLLAETILSVPGAQGPSNPLHLLQPGELRRLLCSEPGEILMCEELPLESIPVARLIWQKEIPGLAVTSAA